MHHAALHEACSTKLGQQRLTEEAPTTHVGLCSCLDLFTFLAKVLLASANAQMLMSKMVLNTHLQVIFLQGIVLDARQACHQQFT